MRRYLLELSEEERQMLLMALAHLAVENRGWDDALNRIAVRVDNEQDGRAVMYDQFRSFKRVRDVAAVSDSLERFNCVRCGQPNYNHGPGHAPEVCDKFESQP